MTRFIQRLGLSRFVWGVVVGVGATALVAVGIVVLGGDSEPSTDRSSASSTTSGTRREAEPASSTSTEPGRAIRPVEDAAGTDGGSETGDQASTVPPAPPAGDGTGVAPAQPVSCPAATKQVRNADELQDALDGAQPGDVIALADGIYTGAFVAPGSGTEAQPIFLCGSPAAVLDGGGTSKGYVLHLRGVQHWRIVGFTVRNGQKGVMADGVTNSVIQQLTVEGIGDEGIHLRSASSHNAVLDNTVRQTGLRRETFGEGIYVGSATSNWGEYSGGEPDRSDDNLIQGNAISETTSESIDIKEGTTGGRVIGNVMDGSGMTGADSLVDVKGSDWLIQGNVGRHGPKEGMQTHRILEGWGSRNTFSGNTVDVDGNGNHFYVHDPDTTENRVACDNRTGSGGSVRSNVDCLP